jgi:hypothetical protein
MRIELSRSILLTVKIHIPVKPDASLKNKNFGPTCPFVSSAEILAVDSGAI